MLIYYAQKEYQEVLSRMKALEKELSELPEGELISAKNGKYQKWYVKKEGELKYLPKSRQEYAQKLGKRKFLQLQLKEARQEQNALEAYLKNCPKERKSEKLLDVKSQYYPLLAPFFQSESEEIKNWLSEPFPKNTLHEEHLIHPSISGNILRSKSEMLIDMALISKETIYWEHFGLMDDPLYVAKNIQRLQIYIEHGIIPMQNLIFTCESKEKPLNSLLIENLIRLFF